MTNNNLNYRCGSNYSSSNLYQRRDPRASRSMYVTTERWYTLIWIHLCTPVACLCIVLKWVPCLFCRLHFFHVLQLFCCSLALAVLENTPMTYLTGPSHEVVSVEIETPSKKNLGHNMRGWKWQALYQLKSKPASAFIAYNNFCSSCSLLYKG